MKRLEYDKLSIATSFTAHQDYLELSGSVALIDERTGESTEGGVIQAFIISSKWTHQLFSDFTDGIHEQVYKCAACLEAHNIVDGKAAIIIKSEFSGIYREYETKAFEDITAFMQDVLECDSFITFLPFRKEVFNDLGYVSVWGPDQKAYSIKCRTGKISVASSSDEMNLNRMMPVNENSSTLPILNRLKSVTMAVKTTGLSKDARRVIELFKENGNMALTKNQIFQTAGLDEDDLSMAMMELLEVDLIDELKSESNSHYEDSIQKNKESYVLHDFLQAIQLKDYSTVSKILNNPDFQVNDTEIEGRSALLIALEEKNNEMVRLLLEGGADPNYESEEGVTPIKLCWLTNNREAESLLIEYGAEIDM